MKEFFGGIRRKRVCFLTDSTHTKSKFCVYPISKARVFDLNQRVSDGKRHITANGWIAYNGRSEFLFRLRFEWDRFETWQNSSNQIT